MSCALAGANDLNVATRLGVAGREIPIASTPDVVAKLAAMKIIAREEKSGTVVAENSGAATLGNPLNVVVWLIGDPKKAGHRLKAGHLISVGSFSPLVPPKPGQTVSVSYDGLGERATVTVNFQ